jgi:hypothetical protein
MEHIKDDIRPVSSKRPFEGVEKQAWVPGRVQFFCHVSQTLEGLGDALATAEGNVPLPRPSSTENQHTSGRQGKGFVLGKRERHKGRNLFLAGEFP